MKSGTILAILMVLSTGMGLGSLHNAQAREALPGILTPFGFMLIALTFLGFLAALFLAKRFDTGATGSRAMAIAAAAYLVVIEALNLITTLMSEGGVSGWLFHEYLGIIVAPVLLVWVLKPRT